MDLMRVDSESELDIDIFNERVGLIRVLELDGNGKASVVRITEVCRK